MYAEDFIKRWKDAVLLAFGTLGIVVTCSTFYFNYFYEREELEATFAGFIDYAGKGQDQDLVGDRFAVVNKGNRDAALLDAQLLIWNDHNTNHGPGFHWDPIDVADGDRFQPRVIKPGEVFIVLLPTLGHARNFYSKPIYAVPLDDKYKKVVFGVRFYAMNSKGMVFHNIYPVAYMRIDLDYMRGPTSGYYLERRGRSLFCNCDTPLQDIRAFNSEYP